VRGINRVRGKIMANLVVLGTCLTRSIIKGNFAPLRNNGIGLDIRYGELSPKLTCMQIAPGLVAERLFEDMNKTIKQAPEAIQIQYNAVVKPTSFQQFSNSIGNEDILLFDVLGELSSVFNNGKEEFQLFDSFMYEFGSFFPGWFKREVWAHVEQYDMRDWSEVDSFRERLIDVLALLDKMFGGRVILLESLFADKIYYDEFNAAGIPFDFSKYTRPISMLKVDANGRENIFNYPFYKYKYYKMTNYVRHHYPSWKLITIDDDLLYVDPNQSENMSPFYLHPRSFMHFYLPLENAIREIKEGTTKQPK
jgi:hypothetical protein